MQALRNAQHMSGGHHQAGILGRPDFGSDLYPRAPVDLGLEALLSGQAMRAGPQSMLRGQGLNLQGELASAAGGLGGPSLSTLLALRQEASLIERARTGMGGLSFPLGMALDHAVDLGHDRIPNTASNIASSQIQEGIPMSLPALLARPEDSLKLSSHQVFLRYQIEAFEATEDDVATHTRGRNKPISLGQVGIRCRHCAHVPVSRRQKGSTYFPATLLGLYQVSFVYLRLGHCS